MISETNLYELHHKARLAIKPGITGMWQVSGRSDITDFEEVVRLDREYISNWNIGMDIKILVKVVETKNIVKTATGAEADGKVIDVDSLVSMNMWGLTPDFLDVLEEGFKEFFEKEVPDNPLKSEYLIPIFIGELLEQGKMSLQTIGDALNLNPIKVRKLLITDGVYESDVAEKVQDTFEEYRETQA